MLDITLGAQSGLDLLPELRTQEGKPIPVIIFSANEADCTDPQVEARFSKSRSALNDLVAAIHDRLMLTSRSTGEPAG